ncbi:signal peptidase I [Candidatus Berkelbacteria bacterium CG_4_9_14_3_um_filter_39_23]|uniref:Signal peptidase I n=2 Tax=Candidatus Berkelbacteria TaxID=1618330 RepID=A0A2M7CIA1_9BACT|nr:signal peptidase I [Candidatus Berkelbacteria bacterium]OIP06012.1 MAG: signal peptidase I [Candidatus Berkelbacteria bacterium CG2_30_39_44]PIR27695.1 MAG: signal peptidase I [Candidatus Berkelbacteria bacterium CG11_big_fil_rev_8_21_14_0_20_40_23]PIV25366.1 MAG: signal peptidase I [Candidatus Berkelbacteria bacterium CG03_land_8_20_14_0_80_40_36]PIX30898.1 MAG: signal peptidase I [Candidatus Berkelbacteria bacterium CG_4_8_14_3_um_filter_39_27]PIZ29190.1 MAG: signal peptidase I [Candidatu
MNFSRLFNVTYVLFKNVLILAIILIIYHLFIGTIFVVSGVSMEPNFHTGQWVYVNRISFLTSEPHRGEVTITKFPGDPKNKKFVKRLIGLPGEKIEILDNKVFINGNESIESYLDKGLIFSENLSRLLDKDEYFLMGDNRAESHDSRIWGPASRKDLIGKATFVLYPFSDFKAITAPAY